MRILIAEDDFASRKFLSKLLSDYGKCDTVLEGLEAIDAYVLSMKEKEPYELICLDIMMPKIDGVKVLKAIRDLEIENGVLPEKRSKIIMVTALGQTDLVNKAFEYGCDGYVSKPIDTDNLLGTIDKLKLKA